MKNIFSFLIKKESAQEAIDTAPDKFEIHTVKQLMAFRDEVNSGNSFKDMTVTLMNDIDIQSESTSSWRSIGESYACPFEGTFDGGGHTVSGFRTKRRAMYQGLFGNINHAAIKNITVSGTIEGSGNYVGAIAAFNNMSTVENCVNMCDISNNGDTVGGIVGYNIGGTITGCVNKGNIESRSTQVGVIVGFNSKNGVVENCDNTGVINK